jgi:hypothetical protein
MMEFNVIGRGASSVVRAGRSARRSAWRDVRGDERGAAPRRRR